MSRFPYQFFEKFIVRSPLFTYEDFIKTFDKEDISDEELKRIANNEIFQEAIYLASPYLYEEIIQWLSNKELSLKQDQKLRNTLLKYYSRMSTRCTPFGLFSGVGTGTFNSEINKETHIDLIRDTKLDMCFLVNLAQHFLAITEIREQLLFFPNNSIYKVGNKIRYVEYTSVGGKREYIISSVAQSHELQQILTFSQQGKTMGQIAEIITNEEISHSEAQEFVEELIDNQILVSEIEANVSGRDFLDTLIFVLHKIGAVKEVEALHLIKERLNALDFNIGNSVTLYSEIENLIKTFTTEYEKKYLFQTDLYFEREFTINPQLKKELKKGISFLNKITSHNKDSHFEKFKNAFYERFETQEIPLAYALDTEVGIGYRQDVAAKGLHTYLDDLELPSSQKNQNIKIELNPIQQILNEKLQEALVENRQIIQLTDDDFKDFEENWDNLPDTLSFLAEINTENNVEKLYLNRSGGGSAANLLGRFCSEKSNVKNVTRAIAKKEEYLNSDYITAEIIHLPEARIGNVIRRPALRQYEIPYLAQSVLPEENQICVDDLYISLKNNRIILRSKKLNKEIKPYLTNAHNYSANSLPIYHFLCDLKSQNLRSGLYFNWGDLKNIYHFFPRVEYNNIVLSKASWKITKKEIKQFSLCINQKDLLFSKIQEWRKIRQIPQWVQLVKSDHKLTLNLENYDLLKVFIDTIKNEEYSIIEEFLYDAQDNFKREFIFPMYKDEKGK
ncbi:hypothetical protein HNP24_001837 [Chryseobacterium sediminis]|uniref:Lantibiotic dehydratase N-terminal domain-containing protein n=1 Tax=Chryseobacterium sediminis TaxID=1679494 RepID=A0ABR6Q0T6_9FLAO|nr:lantibiotic dehydratase family protein [Chryseobacterium sediminis]MBB6330887.1 hypothetical protein [Chryseobacterium sediminis]